MAGRERGDLDLIPLDRLARWLDRQGVGAGEPIEAVERLGGGSSHAVFRLRRGEERVVLRRPPRHPRPDSARSIVREARILGSLAGTEVPHPRLRALCTDESVIGVCFSVMDAVEGWSPGSPLVEPFASRPAWQREMGLALVDAAAALARVDHRAAGLVDLGHAEGFLERQVPRWRSQLESYRELPGYRPRALPGIERVSAWLEASIPRDVRTGLLHGDLQLPNVMFAYDRPELVAVIDWELSTIGDPMLDLGWLLASWSDPTPPLLPTTYIRPWDGFPSRREMISRYLALTGRDPAAVRYFCVLACFKLGIVLEGSVARAAAGRGDPGLAEVMGRLAVGLFEEAGALIDGAIEA